MYFVSGAPYCSKYPHDIKPTPGYWIECRGGASPVNVAEVQRERDASNRENIDSSENCEMTTHLLTGELSIYRSGSGMKPPPTPTVEAVLTRGRLERQDTIKSNQEDQFSADGDHCPTPDEIRPISKDDLDLVRKPSMASQQPFPNITITIVQPSSPPSSPPMPGKGPAKSSSTGSGCTSKPSTKYSTTQPLERTSTFHESPQKYNTSSEDSGKSPSKSKSEDPFELISFEEEIFEKYFYGREHWNYFTNDEALGPVIMSLKQETLGGRDQFRLLLRTISYSLHGLVPTSAICADRYDREAVVRALGDEANMKPSLVLGQLPSTPDELLKLDQVFVKSELKVGVIYVQSHQVNSEEAILGNRRESALFSEFLTLLGERIRLKGFDKYKGGLDTVHDLTGTESVYTCYKNIEIMFHVSTMLPHEESDAQKLQKKRHIGNDIVCVAFLESDDALFWPGKN